GAPQTPAPEGTDIDAAQVEAVERGLRWLAEHQAEDGAWVGKIGFKLNNGYQYTAERGHVGVTALALMAFLAGGHLPGRGEYGGTVERGLDWILAAAQDDGYITTGGSRMYDHAFATLFLAEIYGMTHREDVRLVLQKAVDLIVRAQNAEGGWRYEPYAPESDMSIVVCQVVALRAARNIGIVVPRATVDRAAQYVVDSAVTEEDVGDRFRNRLLASEIGAFHYQRGRSSRASVPLTAAGVTALHGLGIYSDDAIRRGLDYLAAELEEFNRDWGVRQKGHYFFWYGHYYGVQAMYTAGTQNGVRYWEPYFQSVRRTILDLQRPDGSFPNATGPGDAFGTAVAVLILEIPYRYLPIFQR
ncbi:MAG TPA: prenyltransferase/squalene oxidase repeat-containing protein, partial [Planctomycetota bacterium]|nr:prenyltransferase/squalene oxidase repeat-containing protein [Planctomycetota bacterium]